MTKTFTVTTDRLYLAPFAPEHAKGLYALNSDPEVMQYLGAPQSMKEIKKSIDSVTSRWGKLGYAWWTILLKDTDTVIGAACLQNLAHDKDAPLEMGWRLLPKFQGKGYATEAGKAAMGFGFDVVGVDYLCAVANPENMASQKVMQRLGMTYVGVQTHYDEPCAYYEMHKP